MVLTCSWYLCTYKLESNSLPRLVNHANFTSISMPIRNSMYFFKYFTLYYLFHYSCLIKFLLTYCLLLFTLACSSPRTLTHDPIAIHFQSIALYKTSLFLLHSTCFPTYPQPLTILSHFIQLFLILSKYKYNHIIMMI